MISHQLQFLVRLGRTGLAAAILGGFLGLATPASAQLSPVINNGDPNISIDLSVLEDGGLRRANPDATFTAPVGSKHLLIPKRGIPVSQLHVKPKSKASRTAKAAKRGAPKLRAPTRRPAVKRVAAAKRPTAPKVAAASARKSSPPPAQKKAKVRRVAKKAPTRPVKPTAIAPPPAKVPAPKVAVAPPPPPIVKPMASRMASASKAPPPPPVIKPARAPEAAPKVASKAEPASKKSTAKQTTSRPPAASAPGTTSSLRIEFAASATKVSKNDKQKIGALIARLEKDPAMRLQLLAYAGGSGLSGSKARRLSLSRALSVRSHLIEKGIRSTRIDVRALGNKTTVKPSNRVDLNLVKR